MLHSSWNCIFNKFTWRLFWDDKETGVRIPYVRTYVRTYIVSILIDCFPKETVINTCNAAKNAQLGIMTVASISWSFLNTLFFAEFFVFGKSLLDVGLSLLTPMMQQWKAAWIFENYTNSRKQN